MKILVTGSEGSLMQHVIPILTKAGHEITGVDSFYRYGIIQKKRDYLFIEGDLYDKAFVETIISDIDYVIEKLPLVIHKVRGISSVYFKKKGA